MSRSSGSVPTETTTGILYCVPVPAGVTLPPGTVLCNDGNVYQASGVFVGKLDATSVLPFKGESGQVLHRLIPHEALPPNAVLATDGLVYTLTQPPMVIGRLDLPQVFIPKVVAPTSETSGLNPEPKHASYETSSTGATIVNSIERTDMDTTGSAHSQSTAAPSVSKSVGTASASLSYAPISQATGAASGSTAADDVPKVGAAFHRTGHSTPFTFSASPASNSGFSARTASHASLASTPSGGTPLYTPALAPPLEQLGLSTARFSATLSKNPTVPLPFNPSNVANMASPAPQHSESASSSGSRTGGSARPPSAGGTSENRPPSGTGSSGAPSALAQMYMPNIDHALQSHPEIAARAHQPAQPATFASSTAVPRPSSGSGVAATTTGPLHAHALHKDHRATPPAQPPLQAQSIPTNKDYQGHIPPPHPASSIDTFLAKPPMATMVPTSSVATRPPQPANVPAERTGHLPSISTAATSASSPAVSAPAPLATHVIQPAPGTSAALATSVVTALPTAEGAKSEIKPLIPMPDPHSAGLGTFGESQLPVHPHTSHSSQSIMPSSTVAALGSASGQRASSVRSSTSALDTPNYISPAFSTSVDLSSSLVLPPSVAAAAMAAAAAAGKNTAATTATAATAATTTTHSVANSLSYPNPPISAPEISAKHTLQPPDQSDNKTSLQTIQSQSTTVASSTIPAQPITSHPVVRKVKPPRGIILPAGAWAGSDGYVYNANNVPIARLRRSTRKSAQTSTPEDLSKLKDVQDSGYASEHELEQLSAQHPDDSKAPGQEASGPDNEVAPQNGSNEATRYPEHESTVSEVALPVKPTTLPTSTFATSKPITRPRAAVSGAAALKADALGETGDTALDTSVVSYPKPVEGTRQASVPDEGRKSMKSELLPAPNNAAPTSYPSAPSLRGPLQLPPSVQTYHELPKKPEPRTASAPQSLQHHVVENSTSLSQSGTQEAPLSDPEHLALPHSVVVNAAFIPSAGDSFHGHLVSEHAGVNSFSKPNTRPASGAGSTASLTPVHGRSFSGGGGQLQRPTSGVGSVSGRSSRDNGRDSVHGSPTQSRGRAASTSQYVYPDPSMGVNAMNMGMGLGMSGFVLVPTPAPVAAGYPMSGTLDPGQTAYVAYGPHGQMPIQTQFVVPVPVALPNGQQGLAYQFLPQYYPVAPMAGAYPPHTGRHSGGGSRGRRSQAGSTYGTVQPSQPPRHLGVPHSPARLASGSGSRSSRGSAALHSPAAAAGTQLSPSSKMPPEMNTELDATITPLATTVYSQALAFSTDMTETSDSAPALRNGSAESINSQGAEESTPTQLDLTRLPSPSLPAVLSRTTNCDGTSPASANTLADGDAHPPQDTGTPVVSQLGSAVGTTCSMLSSALGPAHATPCAVDQKDIIPEHSTSAPVDDSDTKQEEKGVAPGSPHIGEHEQPQSPQPANRPPAASSTGTQGTAVPRGDSGAKAGQQHSPVIIGTGVNGVPMIAPPPGVKIPSGCWVGLDYCVYHSTGKYVGHIAQVKPQVDASQTTPADPIVPPKVTRIDPPSGITLPKNTYLGSDYNVYDEETGRVIAVVEVVKHHKQNRSRSASVHTTHDSQSGAPKVKGSLTPNPTASRNGVSDDPSDSTKDAAPTVDPCQVQSPQAERYPVEPPAGCVLPPGFWIDQFFDVHNTEGIIVGTIRPAPKRIPVPPGVKLPEGAWLGEDYVVYDANGCRIGELKRTKSPTASK